MTTFTTSEHTTIRTAAYGAVQLLSAAHPGPISSTKQNLAGALTLSAVTGSVGVVLSGKEKIELKGTFPEVAERVLPAITEAVTIIKRSAPGEVENFQNAVVNAVNDALSTTGNPKNAQLDVLARIKSALGVA